MVGGIGPRKELAMNLGRTLVIGIGIVLCSAWMLGQPGRCEAQGTKYAQVSLPQVYQQSKRLKGAVEEANQLRTNAQAKLSVLAKEIQELRNKLKKESATLKPDQKQNLERDLQEKTEKLRADQTQVQVTLAFKEKSVKNVLKTQLPKALEEVAKKEGVSVIFWDGALAYATGMRDVSKEVAEALDAMPAPEKGPVQGPVPQPVPQKK